MIQFLIFVTLASMVVGNSIHQERLLNQRIATNSSNVLARHETRCPTCPENSICCRGKDSFQCCHKIYVSHGEMIEIDREKNLATDIHSDGATFLVDFNKGLWFSHDPDTEECAVGAGVDFDIDSLGAASENENSSSEESDSNKATKAHYSAKIPDTEPLGDKSLLPEALREKCREKPVYWHERVVAEDIASKESEGRLEKRLPNRTTCICWWRCWFSKWRGCEKKYSIG